MELFGLQKWLPEDENGNLQDFGIFRDVWNSIYGLYSSGIEHTNNAIVVVVDLRHREDKGECRKEKVSRRSIGVETGWYLEITFQGFKGGFSGISGEWYVRERI